MEGGDLLNYLQHVLNKVKELRAEGDDADIAEEVEMILDKALVEVKAGGAELTSSREGSELIELLLKHANTTQHVLEFFSCIEGRIVDLSFDCFGSRVMESWLAAVSRLVLLQVAAGTSGATEQVAQELNIKPVSKTDYKAVVKCLKGVCEELQGSAKQEGGGEQEKVGGWGWIELLSDGSASHVARKLMSLLVADGSPQDASGAVHAGLVQPAKKKRRDQLAKVCQVPRVQLEMLSMHLDILRSIATNKRSRQRLEMVLLKTTQAVIESHYGGTSKERKSLKKVQAEERRVVEELVLLLLRDDSTPAPDPNAKNVTVDVSNAGNMVMDRIGSHFLEAVVPLLSDDVFFALYQQQFKNHLVEFAQHANANFVVQQMLKSARDEPQASLMLRELLPELSQLLASARGGVIVQMLQASVKYDTMCKEMYTNMLAAVLDNPVNERSQFVPSLLTFLTAGHGFEDQWTGEAMTKKQRQRKRKGIKYALFSMIVQTMLLLPAEYAKIVAHSFGQLDADTLESICCDPAGSRIIETLLSRPGIPTKFKQRLISNMHGHWITMAKSKSGSRCLDKIYMGANFLNKEKITKELATAVKELKKDYFGRFAVQNCKVEQYAVKASTWKESVTGQEKKRRMFDDILGEGKGDEEEESEESEESEEESEDAEAPPKKKRKVAEVEESAELKGIVSLLQGNTKREEKTGAKGLSNAMDEDIEDLFGGKEENSKKSKKSKKERKEKKEKKSKKSKKEKKGERVTGKKRDRSE